MTTELVGRNGALIKYHEEHPKASYRESGELFRISKQRVHFLIKRHERNNKAKPDPPSPRLFEGLRYADVLRDRNLMLLECHKAHPEVSYGELGEHFHLSRHTVYQLIRRQKLNKNDGGGAYETEALGRDRVAVGKTTENN